MAKFLPGRSSAQCRNRFHILKKKCVSTVWSIDEDRKLINFISKQTSTVNYSAMAQHFPDKDRQHIRSRCLTLRKWMRLNPNVDIAKAPRRASRNLGHGVLSHDLHNALKRLKTRIEFVVNDKKINKINMSSAESEIDDAITAMLLQEEREEIEEAKCHDLIPQDSSDEDKDPPKYNICDIPNLKKCLILLRAKLDKNKFLKSPLSKNYKGLLEEEKELVPVIKVKSYSRKKPETVVKVGSAPDIWGAKSLPPQIYMVPPNYSTIMGLRNIMSSTYTQSETKQEGNKINKIFKRTNSFNRVDCDLFLKRCYTLFLWPMLLTNRSVDGSEPDHCVEENLPKKTRFAEINDSVALPKAKAKDNVHKVIDLEESASSSSVNLDLQQLLNISNFDSKKF